MDEINRTRPFFIGLLGGRYGWIPTKEETERNRHLQEKYPWIPEYIESGYSITEMEMQYAVLKSDGDIDAFFFIRDSGSIPAKFREKDGSMEKEKLERLKKEVLAKNAEGLCSADSYSDMAQLGSRVQERLMDMLDRRFPANTDRNAFDEIFESVVENKVYQSVLDTLIRAAEYRSMAEDFGSRYMADISSAVSILTDNANMDKASETAWSAWQKFKKAKDRLSEDERAYCCKYVILMFNKIESSYPNPDELAEAEKEAYLILKPLIFRQTDLDDPTFIKMLIPLAIKASDAHTAEKLDTVISQCRETADTDSLFLMWHISVLKKDAELQAWCPCSRIGSEIRPSDRRMSSAA